jgi:hypothetical protein
MNTSIKEFVSKFKNILSDPETKHSFYMQELDGASQGNTASKEWVDSKGIDPSEYVNALWKEENEDAEALQMNIIAWQMRRPTSLTSEARAIERRALVDALMLEGKVESKPMLQFADTSDEDHLT